MKRLVSNSLRRWIGAGILLPLGFAACGGDAGPPALRVGPVEFSDDDLLGLSPSLQDRLAEIASFAAAVATDSATALGEPLVERQESELLIRQFVAEEILEDQDVSDEQLEGRYSLNPRPELVVRHIIFLAERNAAPAVRDSARASAEAALRRAQAGESFAELAAELSEEPGAADRGGLLQPGRAESWVPEFWNAAMRLEVGEISPVVESQFGFHVLHLDERRTVPFEEVRADVVLEVAALIRNLDASIAERIDRLADSMTVDAAVRDAYLAGTGGSGVIARGTEVEFTAESLARYLAGLEQRPWEALHALGADAFDREVQRAAAASLLAERAVGAGIRLSSAQVETIRNDWRFNVVQWSFPLALPAAADPDLLREAALAALSVSSQSARIARDGLIQRGPLLRYHLPAERPAEEESTETGSTGRP